MSNNSINNEFQYAERVDITDPYNGSSKEVLVHKNLSESHLKNLIKKHGPIRGLMSQKHDSFYWKAGDATHDDVAKRIGIGLDGRHDHVILSDESDAGHYYAKFHKTRLS